MREGRLQLGFQEASESLAEIGEIVAFGAVAVEADVVGVDAEGAELASEEGHLRL